MASSTSHINLAIDAATAKACNDYEGRRMLKVPERKRAIMRLVVVLIVLAFTIWAVEWIAYNSSGFHYKEVDADSKEAKEYFLAVPPGSFLSANPDGMIPANITCPCLGQPSLSWCHFIDFYYIECNEKTNYLPKRTMISQANSSSCTNMRPQNITFACDNAKDVSSCNGSLDTVYDFPDKKTYIQTSNLASPFEVYDLVSKNMQSNIHINNRTIYEKLNSNNTDMYNHSILVMSLVQSMVAQVFDCNTQSTDQQFWDRGNQCGWNLYPQLETSFNDTKFVFGMTIDYEAYSAGCKPRHCYILKKDNFNTRFMRALGEVGGVASIILMGIQMFLWPLVAKICRFPHARTPQVGAATHVADAISSLG